jgi:plasmid stabilization system protein ParE
MRRRSSKTGGEFLWAIVRSPKASHRFFQQPQERCAVVAQFPLMGTARHDLLPSLRSLAVGNYVVFYLPLMVGLKLCVCCTEDAIWTPCFNERLILCRVS